MKEGVPNRRDVLKGLAGVGLAAAAAGSAEAREKIKPAAVEPEKAADRTEALISQYDEAVAKGDTAEEKRLALELRNELEKTVKRWEQWKPPNDER